MNASNAALSPRRDQTLYFIGVTTGQSSIMKVFPRWSEILGLGAVMAGYDAAPNSPAEVYRRVVEHIKGDPNSRGALVTTHKITLLDATRDLFEYLDPHAQLCGEISCISKRDGQLRGHAKDPITAGLSWQAFVPPGHWGRTGGEVLCLGSGGSAIAISVFLSELPDPADRPERMILVNRSLPRFEKLREIHGQLNTDIAFEYVHNDDPARNDELMDRLPPGSMVINATGMGKDRPGSPVTDAGVFPQDGLVWELNYRGDLEFMHQARRQAKKRNLTIEDGWIYFLHGWTQVIAEVFDLELTPETFAELDRAAGDLRPAAPAASD
jgi:shikimate 5-dehydrogenase